MARNGFTMAQVRDTNSLARGHLLRLAICTRVRSDRPVTSSVGRTCKGAVTRRGVASAGSVPNRNLRIIISKRRVLINGIGVVRGFNVTRTTARRANAIIRVTISGRCTKCVLVTSTVGTSTGTTVSKLGTEKVHAVVLAKSSHSMNRTITRRLNVSRIRTRLLPRSGIAGLRRILTHGQGNRGIVFINSNVGSAPMLTHSSVKVTVNKLKSSTTVRTTSVIVVSSGPSGVLATVTITRRAHGVI